MSLLARVPLRRTDSAPTAPACAKARAEKPEGSTQGGGDTDGEKMNENAMTRGLGSSENELHERLLLLWRKFLKLRDVSIDDDFFERGGDSLLAIDLHLELQKMMGRQLPESILVDAPTVREMASRLAAPPPDAAPAPLVRTASAS
jgi:acyl carrier protein